MNVTTENRSPSTRIAVFIDFDNVEIGVKNTLGGQFDIGVVLDAIKERGDIVTKVAYSDWKRAGDYSRVLTQHAIRMVQRNVTPGGDKNGADITMALDALELAFTHDHINTFVIVGGDSDFISLVEKLKQYGRKVIVVGGRQFTSATMQKNCHEFIAYENLSGTARPARTAARGSRPASGSTPIGDALPLVRRALKVLTDREATPQLGLLKSTLLQLDSTFSEREYGASTFRDFMEKAAEAGAVTLRHAGRSIVVDAREDGIAPEAVAVPDAVPAPVERAEPEAAAPIDDGEEEVLPPSPMTMQDGIRAVQTAFGGAAPAPRWPMYVRQAKQFLRSSIEGFDERNYGFASVVDLLRAAGKEGVLRVERDRHGAIRVFPGAKLTRPAAEPVHQSAEAPQVDEFAEISPEESVEQSQPDDAVVMVEAVTDQPIVEAEAVVAAPEDAVVDEPAKRPARSRKTAPKAGKAAAKGKTTRARSRKTTRGRSTASGSGE